MKPRHTPLRTCVACRETSEKRTLVRVVRDPTGVVALDPNGKANGRGAYVCSELACIEAAKKRGSLSRSLKSPIPDTVFEELLALLTPPLSDKT